MEIYGLRRPSPFTRIDVCAGAQNAASDQQNTVVASGAPRGMQAASYTLKDFFLSDRL